MDLHSAMINCGISINFLVTALIGLITIVYIILKRRKIYYGDKLPPFIKHSFGEFLGEFLKGRNHRFQLQCCRESGQINRLPPLPWMLFPTISVVVSDPKLARLVLEGDKDNRECEKSYKYRNMLPITRGVWTMAIKRTWGEGWDSAR
jgi:hypothetical protein